MLEWGDWSSTGNVWRQEPMGHVPPCAVWKSFLRRRKRHHTSLSSCLFEYVLFATFSENARHVFAWRDWHLCYTHDNSNDSIVVCDNSYALGCPGMLKLCTIFTVLVIFVSHFHVFQLLGRYSEDMRWRLQWAEAIVGLWGPKECKDPFGVTDGWCESETRGESKIASEIMTRQNINQLLIRRQAHSLF